MKTILWNLEVPQPINMMLLGKYIYGIVQNIVFIYYYYKYKMHIYSVSCIVYDLKFHPF